VTICNKQKIRETEIQLGREHTHNGFYYIGFFWAGGFHGNAIKAGK
jgi:hypothetical protein